MTDRRGPPKITPGTRWRDRVEDAYFTVLLTPLKAHAPREGQPFVLALGEDGVPKLYDVDYWHEDFEPAGKPEGAMFSVPAPLPR